MKNTKKFMIVTILLVALLVLTSGGSFAWLTSAVEPVTAEVKAAKVKVTVPKNFVPDLSEAPFVAGESVEKILDGYAITNESNREVVIKVSPKLDGWLKILSTDADGASTWNQNHAFLWELDDDAAAEAAADSDALKDLFGSDAGSYLADTRDSTGAGDVFWRIDSAWNGTAKDGTDVSLQKLAYGSAHFAAVRTYAAEHLVRNMITALAKNFDAESFDADKLKLGSQEGLVYFSSDGKLRIYWERGMESFYLGLHPGDGGTPQALSFENTELYLPSDLGGGTTNDFWLPNDLWQTQQEADLEGIVRSQTYSGNDENDEGDVAANTRLNEHSSKFTLTLDAKAVQATEAAVFDVFGLKAEILEALLKGTPASGAIAPLSAPVYGNDAADGIRVEEAPLSAEELLAKGAAPVVPKPKKVPAPESVLEEEPEELAEDPAENAVKEPADQKTEEGATENQGERKGSEEIQSPETGSSAEEFQADAAVQARLLHCAALERSLAKKAGALLKHRI